MYVFLFCFVHQKHNFRDNKITFCLCKWEGGQTGESSGSALLKKIGLNQ